MHSQNNMLRFRFTADIIVHAFSAAAFQIFCVGLKMWQKFLVPVSRPFTSRKQSTYSPVSNLKTIRSLLHKGPERK